MIVNATKDAVQFSVPEAKKTIAGLEPLYRLYGHPENLRHAVFESGHDYNKAMREAAYGWFDRHLAGPGRRLPDRRAGDQDRGPRSPPLLPGRHPPRRLRDPAEVCRGRGAEAVRGQGRPVRPRRVEGRGGATPRGAGRRCSEGSPTGRESHPGPRPTAPPAIVRFEPEPGLTSRPGSSRARRPTAPRVILLDLDGGEAASASPLAAELRKDGWSLVTLDLRATGRLAVPSDKIGHAPDHNSAEWGLWIGRPLMGQWVLRRPPAARRPRARPAATARARRPWSESGPAAWWPSPRRRPTRGCRGSRRSGRWPATSRTSPTGASASA